MVDPQSQFRNDLRRNVSDSAHGELKRLSGQGRKRKRSIGGKQLSRVMEKKKNI